MHVIIFWRNSFTFCDELLKSKNMDELVDWNGRIESSYWFSFQISYNDSICDGPWNNKYQILELLTMQKSQMAFIITYFHYHVITQLFLDHWQWHFFIGLHEVILLNHSMYKQLHLQQLSSNFYMDEPRMKIKQLKI
jgi:hypothetical protein